MLKVIPKMKQANKWCYICISSECLVLVILSKSFLYSSTGRHRANGTGLVGWLVWVGFFALNLIVNINIEVMRPCGIYFRKQLVINLISL